MTANAEVEAGSVGAQYSRVGKNTAIYLLGQAATWLVTLLTITVIPRRLGETAMGQITVISSVVMAIGGIFNAGIEQYLTKEIGRDGKEAEHLVRATFGLRLAVLGPAVIVSSAFLAFALGLGHHRHPLTEIAFRSNTGQLMLLSIAYILLLVPMFLASPLGAAMVGTEDARAYAIVSFELNAGPILALPFLQYGAISLAGATLASWLVCWLTVWHWGRQRMSLKPSCDPRLWIVLVRRGVPFLVNGYVLTLYGLTSTFVLRYYGGDSAVGVYGQASRLAGTVHALPAALAVALLPMIARLADLSPKEFERAQSRMICLLMIIGIPATVLLFSIAYPLQQFIYGPQKFVDLPLPLQVLAVNIIPVFLVTTLYQFLVAKNRTATWTVFLVGTVAVNAIACLVLVPLCQRLLHNAPAGAAFATLIAECGTLACALWLLRVNLAAEGSGGRVLRALVAGAIMALVMWAARGLFFAVAATVGLAVFVALAWVMKLLAPDEQQQLARLLRRKLLRRAD